MTESFMMIEDWRLAVLKCRAELCSDISFEMVAPTLIERGILSADEYARFRDLPENKTQVEGVIRLLACHKGEAVYLKFLEYLQSDYDWLALQIEECRLTAEDRQSLSTVISSDRDRRKGTYDLDSNDNLLIQSNSKKTDDNSPPLSRGERRKNTSPDQCSTHTGPSSSSPSVASCTNTSSPVLSSSLLSSVAPPCVNISQPASVPGQPSASPGNVANQCEQNQFRNSELSLSVSDISCHLLGAGPSTPSSIPSHHPPCSTPSCSTFNSATPPREGSQRSASITSLPGSNPVHSLSPHLAASTQSLNGSSPIHSSDMSIFSGGTASTNSAGRESTVAPVPAQRGTKRGYQDSDEISEDMIEFVSSNPQVMKKWKSLAHQTSMSSRIPIIQARIRQDGLDFDEHVSEFLREWMERKPGEATIGGLINLLRKLRFNDTAMRIEDGSYRKKLKSY